MILELSNEEANALLQMIHVAVQARGMEAAEAGVVLSRKIQAAVRASAQAQAELQASAQSSAQEAKTSTPVKRKPNGHSDHVD